MKKSVVILLCLFTFSAFSCKKEVKEEVVVKQASEDNMSATKKLDVAVVNESDPVCGMNTAEFLNDTLTYNQEVYGFCSAHCKEEFKKNPTEYLTQK